ncbi:hypothetical protein BGX38DRAFT_1147731 [Terfezia claveryi]|nr:hypothetical protein BGX38DRAFT_1147731 [Terfezia claveryi]
MPGKQTGDLKSGKGRLINTTTNNIQNIPAIEAVTRISPETVLILQTEAENQVMKYLSSANYLAIYRKRSTLKIQDFQTLERILAVEHYNGALHHTQTGGMSYNYRDMPN